MTYGKNKSSISFVLWFYLICFVLRNAESILIRTDQTVIGEAFIHKLLGIVLLAMALRLLQYRWADIGFCRSRLAGGLLKGALLGGGAFAVAYGVEMITQAVAGNAPTLRFYATSYTVLGNISLQGGFLFILACIVGNIINVVMEEGVFRGFFVKLMENRYSFWKACLFSSALFGLWHIAQPLRNLIDGEQSLMSAATSALLLVITSTLFGIQLCMLMKLTGSLWAGMMVHFINNASVNLLHVVTTMGMDAFQTMRITVAQTLAFIVVLVMFLQRKKAGTFIDF